MKLSAEYGAPQFHRFYWFFARERLPCWQKCLLQTPTISWCHSSGWCFSAIIVFGTGLFVTKHGGHFILLRKTCPQDYHRREERRWAQQDLTHASIRIFPCNVRCVESCWKREIDRKWDIKWGAWKEIQMHHKRNTLESSFMGDDALQLKRHWRQKLKALFRYKSNKRKCNFSLNDLMNLFSTSEYSLFHSWVMFVHWQPHSNGTAASGGGETLPRWRCDFPYKFALLWPIGQLLWISFQSRRENGQRRLHSCSFLLAAPDTLVNGHPTWLEKRFVLPKNTKMQIQILFSVSFVLKHQEEAMVEWKYLCRSTEFSTKLIACFSFSACTWPQKLPATGLLGEWDSWWRTGQVSWGHNT